MIDATAVTTSSVAIAMATSTNAPKPKLGWAIASRKKNGPAQRKVRHSIRAEPTFRSARASTAPTGPPTLAIATRTLTVNASVGGPVGAVLARALRNVGSARMLWRTFLWAGPFFFLLAIAQPSFGFGAFVLVAIAMATGLVVTAVASIITNPYQTRSTPPHLYARVESASIWSMRFSLAIGVGRCRARRGHRRATPAARDHHSGPGGDRPLGDLLPAAQPRRPGGRPPWEPGTTRRCWPSGRCVPRNPPEKTSAAPVRRHGSP